MTGEMTARTTRKSMSLCQGDAAGSGRGAAESRDASWFRRREGEGEGGVAAETYQLLVRASMINEEGRVACLFV